MLICKKWIYQLPEIHDSGCSFVNIPEFLLREAEHLEGVVGELKVLIVINALNLGLTLKILRSGMSMNNLKIP